MAQCLYARLIQESAYKTPVTLDTLNSDHIVLELIDDDAVSVEPVANSEQLYSWLACGEPDRHIGETSGVSGTIRTLLYPAQAPLLLGAAFQPIVDGTPDTPWESDEPDGEFASFAMDLGYRDDSGTLREARYLGGKFTRVSLSAARGTRDGAFVFEGDVTFSSSTTAGTAPTASDYPTGAPYFLSATSGNLSINSASISNYESITLEANYTASARFDESATVSRIRHRRREFTLAVTSLLKFTPDWRALQLARTEFPATLALLYPGGSGQQQITFDFGDVCRVTDNGWTRSLPLGADRMQTLTILSQYDRDDAQLMTCAIGTQGS